MASLPVNLIAEWHGTLNGELTPDDVTAGSGKKVWWKCSKHKDHAWCASVYSRTRKTPNQCPVCANRQILSGFNDLLTKHPEIAAEWHPTLNGNLVPEEFLPSSKQEIWWQCKLGHSWQTKINLKVRGSNCSICSGKTIVSGLNDLAFLEPRVAAEWHPTLNGELKPTHVSSRNTRSIWWQCYEGHEWKNLVSNRVRFNQNCPYCVGKKAASGINDLATLKPAFLSEWHPNKNLLKPQNLTIKSHKKIWWLCVLGHEYEATVAHRTEGKNCPFCAGRKIKLGFNDFITLNPELCKEWDYGKNIKTPSEYTTQSGSKVWWKCSKGHSWEAFIYSRTSTAGNGCKKCAYENQTSQAEREIIECLKQFNINVETSDRTILAGKELDIYLPDHKIAIEYNGIYWHTERFVGKKSHYEKWLNCKQQGIQLIQIWEDDWRKDKEKILKSLSHKIGLNNDDKVFARKTQIVAANHKEARSFMEKNHIQGHASGSYYLSLKSQNTDEILALMTIKKRNEKQFEIVRYATSKTVVGGFTKLLNYVEKTYKPETFVTFADHAISNGLLYENNGFIADKEIPPDYMYLVKSVRTHKFGYRINKFKTNPDLLWQEGMTETELATLNNIPRIWDAGKTRYIKNVGKTQE